MGELKQPSLASVTLDDFWFEYRLGWMTVLVFFHWMIIDYCHPLKIEDDRSDCKASQLFWLPVIEPGIKWLYMLLL